MKPLRSNRFRIPRFALPVGVIAALAATTLHAKPVPDNLGNGLNKLVESRLAIVSGAAVAAYDGFATQDAADAAALALTDDQGRVMVDIYLSGARKLDRMASLLPASFPSLRVTASDKSYRAGVIEGYVSLDEAAALAQFKGVSSVILSLRPVNNANIGSVYDQGVTQHKVNQINQIYTPGVAVNYDGTGVTIGVMSDSFDTATTFASGTPLNIHAAQDVASGDLPGAGNPVNSQPVVNFQDYVGGLDEGRAMCQIIYKMAPKAKLGYATAFTGQVSFADNIRSLAGLPSGSLTQAGFKADIIVDDISYFAEPFFSDGIVAQGVNDVVNAGVSYFSSAANNSGASGYDSDFRLVPNGTGITAATNTALVGTNIDLTGVPPSAYAGGFHNFRADGGQDVAQTINLPANPASGTQVATVPFDFQWNDPFDVSTPVAIQPPIFGPTVGTIATGTSSQDFSVPGIVQGNQYVISVTHNSDSPNLDVIVTLFDPSGNQVLQQDTGTDEIVTFFAPATGTYRVNVSSFGDTTGNFTIVANQTTGVQRVTTDFNVLLFDVDTGALVGGSIANNLSTNQPIELFGVRAPRGKSQVQVVISRANTPTAPRPADHLRYLLFGNGITAGPAEYFNYLTPVTFGHSAAAGANSVAAYSPFRPYLPEDFTSPGPVTIYSDASNSRLATPQVRLKPDVAAMDGGNTTFFTGDTSRDADTSPNFFGTSAAAPHAAAIGALVIQARGGPGTVSPAQLKSALQRSAFPHDLDPFKATATATATNGGVVTLSVTSDDSYVAGLGGQDANAFKITYAGPSSLTSITFDASGGNVTGGNIYRAYPGLVFDPRPVAAGGFPFTVGPASVGLTATDVFATVSNQAPAPSVAGEFYNLNLAFTAGSFTAGKTLSFGISRDEQHSAFLPQPFAPGGGDSRNGKGADLFGAGVRIPQGNVAPGGVTFTGTLADGSTFSGTFVNNVGNGYSPLDGYGFINAQTAVTQNVQ